MPLCESRSHSHSSCRERVHRLAVLQLAVPLPSIPFPPPLLSFHSLQLFHPWFRRFIIRASGCWRRVSDACYTRGARGRERERRHTYIVLLCGIFAELKILPPSAGWLPMRQTRMRRTIVWERFLENYAALSPRGNTRFSRFFQFFGNLFPEESVSRWIDGFEIEIGGDDERSTCRRRRHRR